jgi:hypothetical protein
VIRSGSWEGSDRGVRQGGVPVRVNESSIKFDKDGRGLHITPGVKVLSRIGISWSDKSKMA